MSTMLTFFGRRCHFELRRKPRFVRGQKAGYAWMVFSDGRATRAATQCEVILWRSLPAKMRAKEKVPDGNE